MELDIAFSETWPESPGVHEFFQTAASAVQEMAPELANERLSVSLLFTGDAQIQKLNRQWREKDRPTNVLSFPMLAREELLNLASEGPPVVLGDIAMAAETVAKEAAEKGIGTELHSAHLFVHGLLHLAGYDHVHSDEEAEAMEKLEIAALAKLGIADPYGDRD